MKNLIVFFFFFLGSASFVSAQAPVKVAILGVHHFHNPGADMFNIHQDDVKAPERQKEVLDLVERLLAFEPTKVLIEKPYGDTLYPQRYLAYLEHRGADSLSRNEAEQLGFRIAARRGHAAIYPFDHRQGMDLANFEALAQSDPAVGAAFQALLGEVGGIIGQINERLQTSTLTEFLHYMNLPESVEANHAFYLRLLQLTGEDSWGAVPGVADWYERNIRMFYNLNRIADFDAPEERILLIVGQGHKQIIQDLVEAAPYYEYVEVLAFLE